MHPRISKLMVFMIYQNYTLYFIKSIQLEGIESSKIYFKKLLMLIGFFNILIRIQEWKGSKFFFQNRFRQIIHNYGKSISEDFNLSELEYGLECDFCMSKLHLIYL